MPGGSVSKQSSCNAGDADSISGLGRTPGEGNGNPFQQNPKDREAWQKSMGLQRVREDWVCVSKCINYTLSSILALSHYFYLRHFHYCCNVHYCCNEVEIINFYLHCYYLSSNKVIFNFQKILGLFHFYLLSSHLIPL